MTAPPEAPAALPERLRWYAHLFMALMVLSWIVSELPYPARFITIPLSAAALTFAILALVATRGVTRPELLRVMLAVGGSIAALSAVMGLATVVLAPQYLELSRCEARAITRIALEQCQSEFESELEALLPTWWGS